MTFLRMGAVHIGFLLLMMSGLNVNLPSPRLERFEVGDEAFSSAVEASEKDKWPPQVATIRVTRTTAPRLLQNRNPTETQ